MTEETKKAPVMRFQGFSDDWEQRKLGEVANFLNGRAYKQQELLESGKYRVLRVGNFNTNDKWYYSDLELEENKYANSGDLLYLWATNFGPEIWDEEKVIYHYHIWKLDLYSSEVDKQYMYTWLITDKEKIKQTTNGTTMVHVTKGNMEQREFQLPISIKEQKKIGSFFKQLDNTIALHQRMSDKQKKLKANLLQMMFPRNGEKIPEVRLAGFAEDWAQRTLEDISDKVTEKNKAREFTETLTNSAEYGIISQSDFFDKDISNINSIDGYYVVRPDDFVYNPRISNFAPVGPIKRNNLNRIGIMSPLYYVFRPKGVDHTFLEKYFETSYWHIFMKMNGDSGARADRFAIKDVILKEMPIPYPVKEEQVRIGIFFNQLDKSIALHQEKIAHLKTLKNTLLNKMFI